MLRPIKAIRESERAFSRPPGAPYSLSQELIKEYPYSGGPAVEWDYSDLLSEWESEWDEYGWPTNRQEIQIWPELKVRNRFKGTFAAIRQFCPPACGETLDATMLLDHAQVRFRLPPDDRDELDKLTIHEFTRLILLHLLWRDSRHEEDRAWVRSEAGRMRDARIKHPLRWLDRHHGKARARAGSEAGRLGDARVEHPDLTGTKVILKALEFFTGPEIPGPDRAVEETLTGADRWCLEKIRAEPKIRLGELIGLGKAEGFPAPSTINKSLRKLKKMGLVRHPGHSEGYVHVGPD